MAQNRRTDIFQLEQQRSDNKLPQLAQNNKQVKVLDSKNIDDIFGTNLNQYNQNKKPLSSGRQKTPLINNNNNYSNNNNSYQQLQYQPQQEYNNYQDPIDINNNNNSTKIVTEDVFYQMNRLIQERVKNIEEKQQSEIRKQRLELEDVQRERLRMEENMKILEDRNRLQIESIRDILEQVEIRVRKDNGINMELEQKIIQQEQQQKEILYYIKQIQKQGSTDLLQFRELIQDKLQNDQTQQNKEKEKSKALFHELVRLGEQLEKFKDQTSQQQLMMEQKISGIENQWNYEQNKSNNQQQQLVLLNNQNKEQEKLEKKVVQLETVLIQMGIQDQKNREQIMILQQNNDRLIQDAKQLAMNLEQDYNGKLQLKVQEIVNQLMQEQQQRIQDQQELKQQLEFREKISKEQQVYTKEELVERYKNLEGMIRNEQKRREEQYQQFQRIVEQQQQSNNEMLNIQEKRRLEAIELLRQQQESYQQMIMREQEIFENKQTSISEKIAEMIKIEVHSRVNSDMDLKGLSEQIAQDSIQGVAQIRVEINQLKNNFTLGISECLEQANNNSQQLSHYLDSQISKINELQEQKSDKMKQIMTKLAEQFKNHLMIYEAYKKENNSQLSQLQFQLTQQDNHHNNSIKENHSKSISCINDSHKILALSISSLEQLFNDQINKLQTALQSQIQLNQDQANNNKNNLQFEIDKVANINKNCFESMGKGLNEQVELVEILIEHIQEIERVIHLDSKQFNQNIQNINNTLTTLKNKLDSDQQQLKDEFVINKRNTENEMKIFFKEQQGINEGNEKKLERLNHNMQIQNEKQTEHEYWIKQLEDQEKEKNMLMQDLVQQYCLRLEQQIQIHSQVDQIKEDQLQIVDIQLAHHQLIKQFNTNISQSILDQTILLFNNNQIIKDQLKEICDNKIQAYLEKIKLQNQQMWQSSLDIQSNITNTSQIKSNIHNNNLLNEINLQQDLYSKPKLK